MDGSSFLDHPALPPFQNLTSPGPTVQSDTCTSGPGSSCPWLLLLGRLVLTDRYCNRLTYTFTSEITEISRIDVKLERLRGGGGAGMKF
jgi:hypothetical protein